MYQDLRDLIMVEKLIEGIPFNQARFILERAPVDMKEAVTSALRLNQRRSQHAQVMNIWGTSSIQRTNQKTKSQETMLKKRKKVKETTKVGQNRRKKVPNNRNCFHCNLLVHIARNCPERFAATIIPEMSRSWSAARGCAIRARKYHSPRNVKCSWRKRKL